MHTNGKCSGAAPVNSTMRPCTPTVQSAQSAAFSNAHSSDTVHRSEGSSFAATGGKRLSRSALRSPASEDVR